MTVPVKNCHSCGHYLPINEDDGMCRANPPVILDAVAAAMIEGAVKEHGSIEPEEVVESVKQATHQPIVFCSDTCGLWKGRP